MNNKIKITIVGIIIFLFIGIFLIKKASSPKPEIKKIYEFSTNIQPTSIDIIVTPSIIQPEKKRVEGMPDLDNMTVDEIIQYTKSINPKNLTPEQLKYLTDAITWHTDQIQQNFDTPISNPNYVSPIPTK